MAGKQRRTILDSFPSGSLDREKIRETFAQLREANRSGKGQGSGERADNPAKSSDSRNGKSTGGQTRK